MPHPPLWGDEAPGLVCAAGKALWQRQHHSTSLLWARLHLSASLVKELGSRGQFCSMGCSRRWPLLD